MKSLDYYLSLPYKMVIIPDPQEGGFTAVYPELPGCLTCAETLEQLVRNAEEAKRLWLEAALEDVGDIPEPGADSECCEYSGQYKLRMPKSLHRSLMEHAKAEGVSMNQYCNYLLTKNDAEHTAQKKAV